MKPELGVLQPRYVWLSGMGAKLMILKYFLVGESAAGGIKPRRQRIDWVPVGEKRASNR
jgi:hypothetical protein